MRTSGFFVCGIVLSGLALASVASLTGTRVVAQERGAQAAAPAPTLTSLQAEVDRLKSIAPTQSHVMSDVAIQFNALWFAANKRNWPLAAFYYQETRGRINWTVRINPTPKAAGSQDVVDIKGIFDGIDTGVMAPLKAAIDKKDLAAFTAAYKLTLESCYACHKATGRPFLRPQVPTVPAQPIINPDPAATWPS